MPSTDIDGSPILILSLDEADTIHRVLGACGFPVKCVRDLEIKVARFLEEANANTDKETD
jgi:hypothetical protein